MIIKGRACRGTSRNIRDLAKHLQRADTNESVALIQVRGTVATDIASAIEEMALCGRGGVSRRPLYHANIDPAPQDPAMTLKQEIHAVDRLGAQLGLAGHKRLVIRHKKEGRHHLHIIWCRVDTQTMQVNRTGWNYVANETIARELEAEFNFRQVPGVFVGRAAGPRPTRTPSDAEMRQAERTGISAKAARTLISNTWNQVADAGEFISAMTSIGWTFAQGDRHVLVVVDPKGGAHSVARLAGASAAVLGARMGLTSFPTVAQVRQALRKRVDEGGVTSPPFQEPVASVDPIGLGAPVEASPDRLIVYRPNLSVDSTTRQSVVKPAFLPGPETTTWHMQHEKIDGNVEPSSIEPIRKSSVLPEHPHGGRRYQEVLPGAGGPIIITFTEPTVVTPVIDPRDALADAWTSAIDVGGSSKPAAPVALASSLKNKVEPRSAMPADNKNDVGGTKKDLPGSHLPPLLDVGNKALTAVETKATRSVDPELGFSPGILTAAADSNGPSEERPLGISDKIVAAGKALAGKLSAAGVRGAQNLKREGQRRRAERDKQRETERGLEAETRKLEHEVDLELARAPGLIQERWRVKEAILNQRARAKVGPLYDDWLREEEQKRALLARRAEAAASRSQEDQQSSAKAAAELAATIEQSQSASLNVVRSSPPETATRRQKRSSSKEGGRDM